MFSNSVWARSGSGTMSKSGFAFMVSFWTAAGIVMSALGAYITQSRELTWDFLILVMVAGVVGTVMALSSSNPLVSLIGYVLVAFPFGMMLGPVVATYTTASVISVFFVTTGVVTALGVFGAVIPDNLEGWRSWLLGGLVLLLVGYFIVPLAAWLGLPIAPALTALDWIGVLIFSVYVIYDWNRAMRVPYTPDNAIDCALAVYLDFINLFIRLLSLAGTEKSDD